MEEAQDQKTLVPVGGRIMVDSTGSQLIYYAGPNLRVISIYEGL